jgi:hypothetical protein
MMRPVFIAALFCIACEAPDPADAPTVEIIPESEAAPTPEPAAAAALPLERPMPDLARAVRGGGCGQEAAAMPAGGGCGEQVAAPSGSCGGGQMPTGRMGVRPSLSAASLAQFPPHSAPRMPSEQPTTGVRTGSCGQ